MKQTRKKLKIVPIVFILCLMGISTAGCFDGPYFEFKKGKESLTVDEDTEEFFFTFTAKKDLTRIIIEYRVYDQDTDKVLDDGTKFFSNISNGEEERFSLKINIRNDSSNLIERIEFRFWIEFWEYYDNFNDGGTMYKLRTDGVDGRYIKDEGSTMPEDANLCFAGGIVAIIATLILFFLIIRKKPQPAVLYQEIYHPPYQSPPPY